MNRLKKGVPRRDVIEAWLKYDVAKKSLTLPDSSAWPWESADGLDQKLQRYGFKHGVIAGYLSWTLNALTLDDLREGAVVNQAIPGYRRCLGQLEGTPELEAWRPDRSTYWYEPLSAGGVLQQDAPLVLRPSVRSELPARWYLEDASGRALAIMQTAAAALLVRLSHTRMSPILQIMPARSCNVGFWSCSNNRARSNKCVNQDREAGGEVCPIFAHVLAYLRERWNLSVDGAMALGSFDQLDDCLAASQIRKIRKKELFRTGTAWHQTFPKATKSRRPVQTTGLRYKLQTSRWRPQFLCLDPQPQLLRATRALDVPPLGHINWTP